MQLLWPVPDPRSLDDEDLIRHYAPDRSRSSVRLNFVTSIDGAVEVDGRSAALGSPADQRVFNLLRMLADGLMVGAGTLRHEGYNGIRLDPARRAWRTGHGLSPYPRVVVVSSRLDLDPGSAAFTDAPVRPVILTHEASPQRRRAALAEVADVLVYGRAAVDLRAGLRACAALGLGRMLCEGGPHLLGTLTAADLVDEMCLTVAPLLTGPGAGRITAGAPIGSPPRGMALAHVLAEGSVLLLRYVRAGSP